MVKAQPTDDQQQIAESCVGVDTAKKGKERKPPEEHGETILEELTHRVRED